MLLNLSKETEPSHHFKNTSHRTWELTLQLTQCIKEFQ